MLTFLNGDRRLDPYTNFMNIVLIPKVHNPFVVSNFRPINLCNVVYKLIYEVLVDRLAIVLPFIISSS